MVRDGEDRKKKRQRLSATDVEVPFAPSCEQGKKISESDGGVLKMLEAAEETSRALRLRSASKKAVNAKVSEVILVDSPESALREEGKKIRGDTSPEQGSKAVDTLLSLHKLKESERAEIPVDNGEPNLKILLQSAVSVSEHAKSAERRANSTEASQRESLEDLENYIRNLNGVLEEGWKVEVQRSNKKKVTRKYISPRNETFRSRIEVAKHLGVFPDPTKHETNDHLVGSGAGLDLLAYRGSENQTTPILVDIENTEAGNAEGDATGNGRGPPEGSQLHGEDQGTHSQGEASNKRTKEDGLSAPAQSYGKVSEIPNSGKRIKYEKREGATLLQTARKKCPSAMLITQQCQNILRDIISAEKFGALSSILTRGSPLGSLDAALQSKSPSSISSSLDLQLIALRLATGAYGQTPEMFSADMQQVWKNISSVGNELVALAKILSELSDNLYKEQVLNLFPGESEEDGPSNSNPLNEVVDREQDLLPGVTDRHEHHRQLAKCSVLLLDDSHVAKETKPPSVKTTPVRGAHKEINSSHSNKGTGRSKTQQHGNEQGKRMSQSRSHKRLNTVTTESACKKCGLKQGADCIVCTLCSAGYHTYCIASISTKSPDSKWCCPSCAPKAIMQDPDIGSSTQETREVSKNAQELSLIPDKSPDKLSETNLEHLQIDGKGGICSHTVASAQETREVSNNAQELSLIPDQSDKEMSEMSIEPLKITGKGGVCKACGEVDNNVLLCDACDAAYHMKCLIPPTEGVPDEIWYCPMCVRDCKKQVVIDEIGPTDGHHCAVCDRISGKALGLIETELVQHPAISNNRNVCEICRGDEGKKSIIPCLGCEKLYHLSCLKPPLKKVPTAIWYCPSCLCRVCNVDVDDDKILLCDSCDEGYHTYCLTPPLTNVPEGSWYCPSCVVSKNQITRATSSEEAALNLDEDKKMLTELSKRKRKSTEPRRSF